MATPKLALIPTGYKAGKLYSVLPESGVGDFTVVRATEATRVNEEGLIETMGANVPRLDYSGGGCPVLLTEPQRTNLFAYSEDFSQSFWNKASSSVTLTSQIAPNGTSNSVYNLVGTAANLYASGTTGVQHTISFYIKSNGQGKDKFKLRLGNNTSIEYTATNEWVRYEYTATPTTNVFGITTPAAPNDEFNLLIWGAQSEAASYQSSYIKTEGSAVTRNGDQVNGAGDAATFNDSEGVLMFEGNSLLNSGVNSSVTISDTSNSLRDSIDLDYRTEDGRLRFIVYSASTVQVNISLYGIDKTNVNKIALTYKENDFQFWFNGIKLGQSQSGSVPTKLSKLKFDTAFNGSPFYGNTKQVQYFNTALTDSELEKLTSWTSFIEMAQALNYNII